MELNQGGALGKGRRLKNGKTNIPQRSFGMLEQAVIAVGDVFGTTPDCVKAAALLRETARLLGYQLRVRPVSVLAHHLPTNSVAVMGPKVTALLSDEQLATIENHLPDGKDNGHVVLTCEEPRLLIDPNLRQLGAHGLDAPSLMLRIQSTNPLTGEWIAAPKDWQIHYILDEDNRVLIDGFERVGSQLASDAKYLSDMLKGGATAETMRQLLVQPPAARS